MRLYHKSLIQNIENKLKLLFIKEYIGKKIKLELPDKEICYLDIFNNQSNIWIVIVPGGIRGSSNTDYCKEIIHYFNTFYKNKYNIAVINHRGCGGAKFTKKKITLHADYDTIDVGIEYIIKKNNNNKIILVGISMGAYMITSFLEKSNNSKYINKAFCFCHYFDLVNHTLSVQNCIWLNSYLLRETNSLKNKFVKDLNINTSNEKYDNLLLCIYYYILPYRNFHSLDDYYNYGKIDYLNIKTPIIYINSKDDPLTSLEFLNSIKNKYNLSMIITEKGSHLGWDKFFISKTIINNLL